MLWYLLYFSLVPLLWVIIHTVGLASDKIRIHVLGQYSSLYSARRVIRQKRNGRDVVLFHAASAGEYEQVKPILRRMDRKRYFLVQSFFSPTVFRGKTTPQLYDAACYHPFDFPWSALIFFLILKPRYYVITRHDIWPHHVLIARILRIKTILINANLHERSLRLKPVFLPLNRWLFSQFHLILTGSDRLAANLKKLTDTSRILVTGDTRFDQVLERKEMYDGSLLHPRFAESMNFIFASTIPSDDDVIYPALKKRYPGGDEDLHQKNHRLVMVPHEADEGTISGVETQLRRLGFSPVRYSLLKKNEVPRVLLVDRVGILADLYFHCHLAYVGAGFGAGVHSVIEPAVHGCPVSFGPNIHILDEAVAMYKQGTGVMIRNREDMVRFMQLMEKNDAYLQLRKKTVQFVTQHPLSSEQIIRYIFE